MKIIEKIQKLLALSKSSNEHEAALAMKKAQELLTLHNLSMGDIEMKQQKILEGVVKVSNKTPEWLYRMAGSVAQAYFCTLIVRWVKDPETGRDVKVLSFVGQDADMKTAVFVFSYLHETVVRLSDAYCNKYKNSKVDGRTTRRSYTMGVVLSIAIKLQDMNKVDVVHAENITALVPVKNAIVQTYLEDQYPDMKKRTLNKSLKKIDRNAFDQGLKDGKKVQINKGVESSEEQSRMVA